MTAWEQKLERMGFDVDLKGTGYFAEGAAYLREHPGAGMMRDVYPALAAVSGTNWESVERCMRYALRAAENSSRFWPAWDAIGGTREPTNGRVLRRLIREGSE